MIQVTTDTQKNFMYLEALSKKFKISWLTFETKCSKSYSVKISLPGLLLKQQQNNR